MTSHIITSGNPLLWLGNWNTQAITLLKSHHLPVAEAGRVGPIIRAVTDLFIRHARELWLQRAKDSPRKKSHYPRQYRSSHDPTAPLARPPPSRPPLRLTPLGVYHRSLRTQDGQHPHLQPISAETTSYDSNSSFCHFASLQRNDISCLSKAIIRQLQALGPQLSPCNCDNPCARFPTDASAPCRNAMNKTECTSSNCSNHQCTNRLTSIPVHLLPILRVINSQAGIFGYALYTTTLISMMYSQGFLFRWKPEHKQKPNHKDSLLPFDLFSLLCNLKTSLL